MDVGGDGKPRALPVPAKNTARFGRPRRARRSLSVTRLRRSLPFPFRLLSSSSPLGKQTQIPVQRAPATQRKSPGPGKGEAPFSLTCSHRDAGVACVVLPIKAAPRHDAAVFSLAAARAVSQVLQRWLAVPTAVSATHRHGRTSPKSESKSYTFHECSY